MKTDSNSWAQTKKHVSGSGSQFPKEPGEQGKNPGEGQGGAGRSMAQCCLLPFPRIPRALSLLPDSSLFEGCSESKQKNVQSFLFQAEKETPSFMNSFLHVDLHHLKGYWELLQILHSKIVETLDAITIPSNAAKMFKVSRGKGMRVFLGNLSVISKR